MGEFYWVVFFLNQVQELCHSFISKKKKYTGPKGHTPKTPISALRGDTNTRRSPKPGTPTKTPTTPTRQASCGATKQKSPPTNKQSLGLTIHEVKHKTAEPPLYNGLEMQTLRRKSCNCCTIGNQIQLCDSHQLPVCLMLLHFIILILKNIGSLTIPLSDVSPKY